MTTAQPERTPLSDLLSSIDHLTALGRELRAADGAVESWLISEVDDTLGEARRAANQLTAAAPDSGWASRGGIDPVSIAYTVGITTLLLPFVQGLVQRAGEDAYQGISRFVRRRLPATHAPTAPASVVVGDRASEAQVIIDDRVDGEALARLQQIDFTDQRLREATLRWNPERQTWDAQPGRPTVDLWLPGDPLDGPW